MIGGVFGKAKTPLGKKAVSFSDYLRKLVSN
jgi:hypothetical protein